MIHIAVPNSVVTIFAYFHIISAMAWLGGAILFVSTVGPVSRRLSRGAQLEFLATFIPRGTRYFVGAATSAIVFGIALFLTIPDFSPYLYIGMATALITYLLILSELPDFAKIGRIAAELAKAVPPPELPAEFRKAQKRTIVTTAATVVLLAVTLGFMVYSGFGV